MRILLLRDAFTPATPPGAMNFLLQVVRQAAKAGHELRELIANFTTADIDLDAFRHEMRRRLDGAVTEFDPQIVYVQGLGVLGHLALETGAPYLVVSWGDELAASQSDPHIFGFAQQAFENAGFVVLDSDAVRQRVAAAFDAEADAAERMVCLTDFGWSSALASAADAATPPLDWLWRLSDQLVRQRRGRRED